jgi:serine/threonine protein phosphatase 1
MMKNGIWVIGDVHGMYSKLIDLIGKLPKDAKICFVGDLIDRGEHSSKVLDLVIENKWMCVLGNHELMMMESRKDTESRHFWLSNGGRETVNSYKYKAVKLEHFEWMESLPMFLHFEVEGHKPLVVSHSYIHTDWIDEKHEYNSKFNVDILWRHMHNKNYFDEEREIENGIFNIFGHSVISSPEVTETYAMIDTGAFYENNRNLGYLSAIHYPSLKIISDGEET